jgi:hypothetical protein
VAKAKARPELINRRANPSYPKISPSELQAACEAITHRVWCQFGKLGSGGMALAAGNSKKSRPWISTSVD